MKRSNDFHVKLTHSYTKPMVTVFRIEINHIGSHMIKICSVHLHFVLYCSLTRIVECCAVQKIRHYQVRVVGKRAAR